MKKVIVTGAAGGIGLATIKYLVENGYYVYAIDIKDIEEIENVKSFKCDLTKEEERVQIENEEEILKLIEERAEAKKMKDFTTADKIRNDLLEKGIRLIDTKDGTTYEVIK